MITADQARELVEISHPKNTKPILDHVSAIIEAAAKEGFNVLSHPLANYPLEIPSKTIEKVWEELRSRGFKVVHHSDPDPGHYASGPYTTIEW